jgi:hypothetical protein
MLNGENEEIEIAFIPGEVNDRASQLKRLAKEFGINMTLYYDPLTKTILDPLCQYKRITQQRELDVCQVLSVNMNNYFSEFPERILDSIYKVAKYRRHQVQLAMSADVIESIGNNKAALKEIAQHKLPLARFDKLFIMGHARFAFQLLHDQFDLISILFPMLACEHVKSLNAACISIDDVVNALPAEAMTKVQLEKLRGKFVADALFGSFGSEVDLQKYKQDKELFYIDCCCFINRINFYVNDSLLNQIQDIWWDRINEQYRHCVPGVGM